MSVCLPLRPVSGLDVRVFPSPCRPSFASMVIMLGLLASVAPASVDAYLPAFGAMAREFGVSPAQVQLTLGLYMACYAFMLLWHGTLSDSLGRRRVVLTALAVYLGAALLAAWAPSFQALLAARALQGLSAGAGVVVGQAIVRDCFEGRQSQRAMSYFVLVLNLSPALAPVLGGYLSAWLGWRAVFYMLALLAVSTLLICAWRLPETLPLAQRQPLSFSSLRRNACQVFGHRRLMALAGAFGLLFAAQAFFIGATPDIVLNVLQWQETDFAFLFLPLVAGAMSGALFAARMAQYWPDARTVMLAYALMLGACLAFAVSAMLAGGSASPAMFMIWPGVFTCGLAMAVPALTLRALALFPHLSGMTASVLAFVQMMIFSVVSGWCVPWVFGRADRLAWAMLVSVALSAAGLYGLFRRRRAAK